MTKTRIPHHVTVDQLIDFQKDAKILFAADGGYKRLYITYNGYLVEQNSEQKYKGQDPEAAIEIYNNIKPERK